MTRRRKNGENLPTSGNKINGTRWNVPRQLHLMELYISHPKGHPGMGGLDISLQSKRSGWEQPIQSFRYPVNTSADDFAFIVDELTGDKGFLSSNREAVKGWRYFTWHLPLIFTVSGRVFDADESEYWRRKVLNCLEVMVHQFRLKQMQPVLINSIWNRNYYKLSRNE